VTAVGELPAATRLQLDVLVNPAGPDEPGDAIVQPPVQLRAEQVPRAFDIVVGAAERRVRDEPVPAPAAVNLHLRKHEQPRVEFKAATRLQGGIAEVGRGKRPTAAHLERHRHLGLQRVCVREENQRRRSDDEPAHDNLHRRVLHERRTSRRSHRQSRTKRQSVA
jgi:hypothetical protein